MAVILNTLERRCYVNKAVLLSDVRQLVPSVRTCYDRDTADSKDKQRPNCFIIKSALLKTWTFYHLFLNSNFFNTFTVTFQRMRENHCVPTLHFAKKKGFWKKQLTSCAPPVTAKLWLCRIPGVRINSMAICCCREQILLLLRLCLAFHVVFIGLCFLCKNHSRNCSVSYFFCCAVCVFDVGKLLKVIEWHLLWLECIIIKAQIGVMLCTLRNLREDFCFGSSRQARKPSRSIHVKCLKEQEYK